LAGNGSLADAAPQHGLLVWGRIGPNGVVLEPSFEIDAPPSLPVSAGPYSVRGTDDAGGEIFNLSFDGVAVDHMPNERHFAFVVPLSASGRRPSVIQLTANGRVATRRSVAPTAAGGASTAALVRATQAGGSQSRLEWDATSYPMALVRDAATGQVLSFAQGGQIDLVAAGRTLDVTLSDGVSSVRRVVAVPPR
jgi:hypothetical protein